ncbi:XdhC family protein [Sinimarinibacterium thermocellulolyticum]|uniref:XdhC/CoxI family protein n=1 Tax=Sinimarinibacterium thermocellulolyticum TaxID=3170016 RepID=A0ABV2A7B8_9GAMM
MNTPEEFATLHAGARRLAAAGGGAIATLLRTQGPVFRRAGTRMLIGRDGSIVRGLSAGCPQADLVTRTRALFAQDGGACIVRYDREHGYDALLELGCGGAMEILVETFGGADELRYLDAVAALIHERDCGWLASWYASDGHCLPRPRRLLWHDGVRFDALGDERVAGAIVAECERIPPGATVATALRAGDQRIEVLIEPVAPPLALFVVGDNDGAHALARLGAMLGWQVTLVGHTEVGDTPPPRGVARLCVTPERVSTSLRLDARSAVVVMTHNLERDLDYLRALAHAAPGYLGALGSRTRARRLCAALGSSAPLLYAPAGLDIGAETPEAIALAIAAEIQAVMHGRNGGALRLGDGPIH